jgi:hypothetical protein
MSVALSLSGSCWSPQSAVLVSAGVKARSEVVGEPLAKTTRNTPTRENVNTIKSTATVRLAAALRTSDSRDTRPFRRTSWLAFAWSTSVGHFAVGEQYQIGDNSADNDKQDGPFDDFQSVGMALRDVASLLKPIHYFSEFLRAFVGASQQVRPLCYQVMTAEDGARSVAASSRTSSSPISSCRSRKAATLSPRCARPGPTRRSLRAPAGPRRRH